MTTRATLEALERHVAGWDYPKPDIRFFERKTTVSEWVPVRTKMIDQVLPGTDVPEVMAPDFRTR